MAHEGLVVTIGGLALMLTRVARAGATPSRYEEDDTLVARVTYSQAVQRMAQAIARAEGYYLVGSVADRLNNPGNLKKSSVPSIGADTSGHLQFASKNDGWEALFRQLQLIVDGRSRVYTLDMTIAQMAARYAESNLAWASNVARGLGVPVTTVLRDIMR
jgi:hypothetical protein